MATITRRTMNRALFAIAAPPLRLLAQNQAASPANGEAFALQFTANVGGLSIVRFEVAITGAHCSYHEVPLGSSTRKEVKFERELSPLQLQDIERFARELKLLTLASQDYKKQPLLLDQAQFSLTLSLDGRRNSVTCADPSSGDPKNDCQMQLRSLEGYLNSLLNVKMF
jgi:hypothetical protein